MEELPYFNTKIKANENDKNKRKNVISKKFFKQSRPNNDQYCIQHDKKTDTVTVKKEKTSTVQTANKNKKKYGRQRKR